MVITCYNETEVDARAVNLTNQVGALTIVPVNFSYPAGSFRVESNLVFTHFTASVTAADGQRVFKITGFTTINEKVIEYYYQLDYLKDYWFRYNVNGSLIIPHTLLISQFSLTRPDEYNYPLDTKVTSMIESVTKNDGNVVHKSCPVIVMKSCGIDESSPDYSIQDTESKAINPAGIYILEDVDCLPKMWAQVIKTYTQFKNNIENTFYVPVSITEITESDEEHIIKTQTDSVFYIGNDGTTTSATFTDIPGKLNHLVLNKSNGIIEVSKDTGINITINDANDLPPYKKYKLYIPYIGWYDVPLNDIVLQHYGTVLNLNVIYLIDICNGMIAAQFSISYLDSKGEYITEVSNYRTPFTYLPKYYFLISDYAAESQMNQISKNNGEITNVISSLGALIPAFINPSLAAPSIASAATNFVNSSINNNLRYQQNQAQASLSNFTSGRDNAIGQIDRQFKLYIDNYYCSLSKNEAAVLTGYPVNKYIGGITPIRNDKYWMDFSSTQITGPEWYVDGVKSDYSKEYITLC